MNNETSKRVYKAYTTFTNVLTPTPPHYDWFKQQLVKLRILALLQNSVTDRLWGLYHLQSTLLWSVVGRLTVTAGDRRPTFSRKLWECSDGTYFE
jgi:hypothetical protein